MVWLHGGGFSSGSANEAQYDGENLARRGDVVVVGVNHRLNVLGHLDLSMYGKKYEDSANIGVFDLIDSLQWIKENIKLFGGNPDNITLFGESGGGAKILALMTTPQAKGLFHKAIIQSGATETMGVRFTDKDISKKLTEEILKNLSISPDIIENLQTLPIQAIWAASEKAQKTVGEEYKVLNGFGTAYTLSWQPVVDGTFIPTNPVLKDGFAEAGKDIFLLIGSNLTEWNTINPVLQHKNMTMEQKTLYKKTYPNDKNPQPEMVDTIIRLPMLKIMSHKADQGGAPVYAYVFTKKDETGASYHTAEIPYVFGNLANNNKLSEDMSLAWANFARYGKPSSPGLPDWEPYNRETQATMILDDTSEVRYHHDKELLHSLVPEYKY